MCFINDETNDHFDTGNYLSNINWSYRIKATDRDEGEILTDIDNIALFLFIQRRLNKQEPKPFFDLLDYIIDVDNNIAFCGP